MIYRQLLFVKGKKENFYKKFLRKTFAHRVSDKMRCRKRATCRRLPGVKFTNRTRALTAQTRLDTDTTF